MQRFPAFNGYYTISFGNYPPAFEDVTPIENGGFHCYVCLPECNYSTSISFGPYSHHVLHLLDRCIALPAWWKVHYYAGFEVGLLVCCHCPPTKWMVKIMENPIKMDDLGVSLFSETSKLDNT